MQSLFWSVFLFTVDCVYKLAKTKIFVQYFSRIYLLNTEENNTLCFYTVYFSCISSVCYFSKTVTWHVKQYYFQRNFSKMNGKDLNTMMTVATGDQWKRIRFVIVHLLECWWLDASYFNFLVLFFCICCYWLKQCILIAQPSNKLLLRFLLVNNFWWYLFSLFY